MEIRGNVSAGHGTLLFRYGRNGQPVMIGYSNLFNNRLFLKYILSNFGTGRGRLEAMSLLVSAVESGSLSAAGRKLGVPLPTVSRKISELEAHLNTRLLTRSTRRLVLTDAGAAYVAAAKRILDEAGEAEHGVRQICRAPGRPGHHCAGRFWASMSCRSSPIFLPNLQRSMCGWRCPTAIFT